MKFLSILITLTILGSANLFAWTATIHGPENPVKGEKYDYKVTYTSDRFNKDKELEKVDYHWVIVGKAIADKKIAKDNPIASVTMANPEYMEDNYDIWPNGHVICIVTLYFKDGTKESRSDSIQLKLVP